MKTMTQVPRAQARAAAQRWRRPSSQGGFSLVEVVIALMVLSVGVLGMAGATGQIVRQITLADLITERSIAFQTIVERIQSVPYDSVDTGSDSIGIFEITWSSVVNSGQSKTVTMITTGPGLGARQANDPRAVDTFAFRILRR
jgi:prepilin-type N-terminal cleavage/methylation domain-containing protein